MLEALLVRMRQHLYSESLPVLASYWLRTLCAAGHNRPWWQQLHHSIAAFLSHNRLEEPSREVLLSISLWIELNVIKSGKIPVAPPPLQPPFRSIPAERLLPYVSRILNEWLPVDVAFLLTTEAEFTSVDTPEDAGIPALAAAKALDRLLIRERVSPETLEALLAPEFLSPVHIYPADTEILRDVVLAHLGRPWAPESPRMPAALLGVAADSVLPPDYAQSVRAAALIQTPAGEELHVPLTPDQAREMLRTDPLHIGSVLVTMDGRAWQSSALHSGDRNIVVYTPGERLRIDFTRDHARLTVAWPETPAQWSGPVPVRGPFQIFGREWHASSWEIQRDSTLLHLTFTRILPICESPQPAQPAPCFPRLRPAYIDMAWSEVEQALAESLIRNSLVPIEDMRRTELIPLARSLYALAESVKSTWLSHRKQTETHLRAIRYHQSATAGVYGRPPWRVLPATVQSNLEKTRHNPAAAELLTEIFTELPKTFNQGHPSKAA